MIPFEYKPFPGHGTYPDGPWLPTSAATLLQLRGHTGGYLRSLHVTLRTSCEPRWSRPRHAADRTRSRQCQAGSRRTKRYGPRPSGPARRHITDWPDWPFNVITSHVRKP